MLAFICLIVSISLKFNLDITDEKSILLGVLIIFLISIGCVNDNCVHILTKTTEILSPIQSIMLIAVSSSVTSIFTITVIHLFDCKTLIMAIINTALITCVWIFGIGMSMVPNRMDSFNCINIHNTHFTGHI